MLARVWTFASGVGYTFYKPSPNRRREECIYTYFYIPDETDYKKALRGNPLSCLTMMYDRSVIGDLYFDEIYSCHENYIF